MLELVKIRKDINWLIDQVRCLMRKSDLTAPLAALEWSTNHSVALGNPYMKDAFVWLEGYVYKSLVDNNEYPPTNESYWTNLGEGHVVLEEQTDWDATSGRAFIRNKPAFLEEAPNDGSQYVRKNEGWDKLTTYSDLDPNSSNDVTGGFPLGSDWYNTVTGEKFYQKGNGVWISYTSGTSPVDGSDSPVMFADYATNARLYTIYNEDPSGDQLISTSNEVLFIDGVAMQVGDTVLIKDQPSYDPIDEVNLTYQNGVYIVTDTGSLTSPYILTRTDYADETSELYPSQVNILKGTSENRFFLQKTVDPVIGLSDIIYEINYVPTTQTVVLPVIHVDTATTEPLPSCTYEDIFAPPVGGIYLTSPSTSYLTATSNGPLGVINGVNMSVSFSGNRNRKILIKNQVDPIQNGDYEVVQIGSSIQPWKLRRITTTYSSFDKNVREWKVNNEACTLYGNRYYMNYNVPFGGVIGVNSITFSELTYALPTVTPSLQDVIDVNKVADRVEFRFTPFQGKAFIGGYDYLVDFTESNQDDGVYIYGDFAQYGTSTGQDIVKINSNGTVDTSFNVGTGFNNYPYNGNGKLAQTAAGKLYAAGSFSVYNGVSVERIVRLNTDGTIDTSFVTGSGFTGGLGYTNSIGLDSSENVYVAGGCTYYNGTSIPLFVKLLPNGSIDTSFVMGSGFSNATTVVLVNSDDTLFVGGHFGTYKGVSSPRFIKLLPNGDIDTSFVVGDGFNNIVTDIVKTLDNKILVTGLFTTYQGVSANRIIKLNLDGSRDTSFVVGTGFTIEPYMVKVMQDGNYLITAIGSYQGTACSGFLIINSVGFPTLNPGLSGYSYTGSTQLSDGRIIGMSNTGATDNYLVQVVNGLPIKDKKLTFSEITGKAEYTIDTLDGTTTYELLPKHLIQNLITESIPVVPTPTLQEVTYAGNTTSDVVVSSLGFETTLFGTINQMAFVGITSISSGGIVTYKGLLSLQAGSLDGTGFMSYLTSDNLTQDRFLKLPNKNGTLAITTDIPAAQVNSNWNATSGVAQILNKPLIPIVDSVPTYGSPNAAMSGGVFDALALKADLVAGKVPSSQLPSYVDDVIEVANYAALPVTGETGKIYVTLDTGFVYRWTGSVYVQIATGGSVTSVGVTMPSAFTVSNSPITSSGDIAITGAGTSSQYVRGDGSLDTFPTIPTKTSDLINDGDNGVSHFISLEDLPSNLILYPTTTASDVSGYYEIVTSITDPDFDATAVDVSTGDITGSNQLIASLATNANIIVGNPGLFNVSTIGNIRRTSGSGTAEFYFEVYKRTSSGTETLITTSSNTSQVSSAVYTQFSATALWNDGVFLATDRIVLKFYGSKVGTSSDPTYDFQFGGSNPIRTTVPIPLAVVPSGGSPLTRQEFTFTSSQDFTLSNEPSYIYGVFVQGQELDSDQYSYTGTTLTILNTLNNSDSVNVLYTHNVSGFLDYYTKAETDTFLNLKQDDLVSGSNIKTINGNSILGSGNIEVSNLGVTVAMQSLNFLT